MKQYLSQNALRNGIGMALALSLVSIFVVSSGRALAAPATDAAAIQARIEKAAQARSASAANLSDMERSLVWLLNFEQPGVLLTADDGVVSLPLDPTHYVPGRFGQGFYFEQARTNLLPAALADVENDITGFAAVGNAGLDSVKTDTAFGKRALSISCVGVGDGFAIPPRKVHIPPGLTVLKTSTLLASFYVKGPEGVRIKLDLEFAPATALDPKTKEPVADPRPDEIKPQIYTLTGEWQRVAVQAVGDSRVPDRIATLTVVTDAEDEVTLLADGFQYEDSNTYPYYRPAPTTWTAGGTTAGTTTLALTSPGLLKTFPTSEGAMAFWTCTPPPETAIAGPGSVAWFAMVRGWNDPEWSLSTYILGAGKTVDETGKAKPYYTGNSLSGVLDGKWHHLVIQWAGNEGILCKDGKGVLNFKRENNDVAALVATYVLVIGGGRGISANSVMDEIALFNRALRPEEVAALAGAGETQLRISGDPAALGGGRRMVFYRDETQAPLETRIFAPELPDGAVTVDCSLAGLYHLSTQAQVTKGQGAADLRFSAAALKPGDYTARVAVTKADGTPAAYREFPLRVVKALRRDTYMLSTWGANLDADHIAYYHALGINQIDVETSNPDTVDMIGGEGCWYNWHCNYNREMDYRPERRVADRAHITKIAQGLAPLPNWKGILINTETGPGWAIPDAEQRRAWFDEYVEKDFGQPVPAEGWAFGSPHNHIGCRFPADQKPGANGVYKGKPSTFAFLEWWQERGGLMWRVNANIAQAVKAVRPDILTWTDPIISRGEFEDLDAACTWSYSTDPKSIFNEFQAAWDTIRGNGKPYWTTLGLNYVSGITMENAEGKKIELVPTADDAIQQAWVATALIPANGMMYWDVDGFYEGERGLANRYAAPGSTEALGQALKGTILPLGTMLNGADNCPRPVALLLPESTVWFDAAEGGFGWGAVHYPNIWKRIFAESGIPFDVVDDNHITPGSLAKYKAIIFPMAKYVSERVYNELTAAGEAGTRIIVDSYCTQGYPNMTQLQMKYDWGSYTGKTDEYLAEGRALLASLYQWLKPQFAAYAEGSEGSVMVGARERDGVRYITVLNNNRQPGPYTELSKKPTWKPYGKAQEARVSILAPAGSVVYDFATSRKLAAEYANGRVELTVDLPAVGGAVLCVYPKEFGELVVKPAGAYTRGTPGTLEISLTDNAGKALPGWQLVDVEITDPAGNTHDESGYYRLEGGKVTVPFRPALNEAAGAWQVKVTERCSGISREGSLVVR